MTGVAQRIFRKLVIPVASVIGLSGGATEAAGSPGQPPPADAAVAAASAKPDPLLPDLTPLSAASLSLQQTKPGQRKIRFDSRLANVGSGPVEVRPRGTRGCPAGKQRASQVIYRDKDGNGYFRRSVDTRFTRRAAGCTLYHPAHDHWHFQATALYSVTRPQEKAPIVVRKRKMSFCLRDSERVPEALGEFHQPQYYGDCSKTSPQGISRGWLDLYASYLVGQAIPLPARLGDGVYCLRIEVDPLNRLRESDESNQDSSRAFRLRGRAVSPVATRPCAG